MKRQATLLFCVLLSVSFAAAIDLSAYEKPREGFTAQEHVEIRDTVVYNTGFVSSDGTQWESFTLTGTQRGNWVLAEATSNVDLTDIRYVAAYSCTWSDGWNCSETWQVLDRGEQTPLIPGEYLDSVEGDYQALMDLYAATDGENWIENTGWEGMTPQTMGGAYGVTTYPANHEHAGRVQELRLFDNHLVNIEMDGELPVVTGRDGNVVETSNSWPRVTRATNQEDWFHERYVPIQGRELPESIGNLRWMQVIDIQQNKLGGPIPNSFWTLENLRVAALGYGNQQNAGRNENVLDAPSSAYPLKGGYWGNKFTGRIPPEIEQMKNLEQLFLERNYFDNTQIPDELWKLPKLTHVALNLNGFTGELPNIKPTNTLKNIQLIGGTAHSNHAQDDVSNDLHLSGPLPANFASLTNVERLSITHNQFTGSIPPEWAAMENLRHFSLGRMDITGPFPGFINNDNMPRLFTLHFTNLPLSGPLPSDYNINNVNSYNINSQLGPPLQGELPESLRNSNHPNFPRGTILMGMINNEFTGPFIDDLSNMYRLRSIRADRNNFTGPLPTGYPTSRDLIWLHFNSNEFTGAIPATIGDMTSERLQRLSFENNNLNSYEPGAISPVETQDGEYVRGLRRIHRFHAHNNQLRQEDIDNIILDAWANVQSRLGTTYENWDTATLSVHDQANNETHSNNPAVLEAITKLEAAGWDVLR